MAELKWTGRVIWRELTSDDFNKSKAFYGELFGWVFEDMDMGPAGKYPIIKANGKGIGGMAAPQMKGQPNAWLTYVCVDDVDASLEAVKANGGKVLAPAMDIPTVGRIGVLADFAGAAIAVMRPSPQSPSELPTNDRPGMSTFCWETVTTPDVGKAVAFYGAVMAWGTTTAAAAGDGKVFTSKDGAQVADLQKSQGAVPPMWLTYVVVEKLETARDRAAKLGGKVLMPLVEIPKVGRIAVVAGPDGAPIGLFEPGM